MCSCTRGACRVHAGCMRILNNYNAKNDKCQVIITNYSWFIHIFTLSFGIIFAKEGVYSLFFDISYFFSFFHSFITFCKKAKLLVILMDTSFWLQLNMKKPPLSNGGFHRGLILSFSIFSLRFRAMPPRSGRQCRWSNRYPKSGR